MPALISYLEKYPNQPEKQAILKEQWGQVFEHPASGEITMTCECGMKRHWSLMYRCYYCGQWFCDSCAPSHFGMSFREYHATKKAIANAKGDK